MCEHGQGVSKKEKALIKHEKGQSDLDNYKIIA